MRQGVTGDTVRAALRGTLVLGLVLSSPPAARSLAAGQAGEWLAYGADKAGTKYSPLDQINKANVKNLRVVWRQSTIPDEVRHGSTVRPPVASQNTPLMAGGLLYVREVDPEIRTAC